jgi:hypothetical protein
MCQVRLVDLCTNVFSEEDTCYHSDHALSRCFAHAAYADIWNVKCQVNTILLFFYQKREEIS